MVATSIDLDRLFRLRLVVARVGEMDLARWWNTRGMLGRHGAMALKRGFPATHYFAQARVVFAVARARCQELFAPPGCMTLWNLPAELEDQFEERWHDWLDRREEWRPYFGALAEVQTLDLIEAFARFDLLSPAHLDAVSRLRRSAEGRAVPLPGVYRPDDEVLTLLAAGFARGSPGSLAIPYARLEA